VLAYLQSPAVIEALGDDALLLQEILDRLPPAESRAARAAVDMAVHDLWGQRLGHPLWRLWGLNPARTPESSFTVSMAEDEVMYRAKLRAARRYRLLKLKLGSGDLEQDLRLVQIAREETHSRFCVDANSGWTAQEAGSIIPLLDELGVIFVEQPVTFENISAWRELGQMLHRHHPPLIADESVQGVDNIVPLAGLVDGISIKLAKCGGLGPARQMIAVARAMGMKVLLSCMVESSVAVTAASHLAPLVDYVDLDAPLLITNDPYRGMRMIDGQVYLPERPGLGLSLC
jgi:L-alanine-DL-glutamate epimerase-like enolase superfamily enzyme